MKLGVISQHKSTEEMNKIYLTVLCLFLFGFASGQEKWSLERCIREALQKSLTIQQVKLNKQGHEIEAKRLRMERLPNLNASTDFGVSFGRVINPVTNDFETENSFYQSVGVNSGVNVFNGFRLRNSIRQMDFLNSAAGEDIRQAENDLALSVALAYLNVLFAYENLAIAEGRIELTNRQLAHLDVLIREGSKPENDRFEILSQLAIDEQSVITAQNNIEINMLSLKQQMLMEPDFPLEIERPEIDLSTVEALENQTFEAVYNAALLSQPEVAAAELREQAEEYSLDISRSTMMPSLFIGANLGTNWSDLASEPAGYIITRIPQPGVFINGESALLEIESEVPTELVSIPYGRQLDNNIGYGVGASVSIPIFNNYSGRAAVETAKIDILNSKITTDLVKQNLKTDVQNAIASARAARKAVEAAEAAAEAARRALRNADKLSEIGSINNFEYLSARNRSDVAETNLLIARYDYFFKVKIIEYYMGRGIRLN